MLLIAHERRMCITELLVEKRFMRSEKTTELGIVSFIVCTSEHKGEVLDSVRSTQYCASKA